MIDVKIASIDELMERRAAILNSIDEVADADLEALDAEVRSIADELEARKAAETQRESIRAQIASGETGTIVTEIETEETTMSNEEIRKTHDYNVAYANYIKTESDKECRALLTENVSGNVPMPVMVEGIIADARRESPILSRVRKTYAKANVKVGFELSAPIATVHVEGSGAMDPENLVLGTVTLQPQTLKKFVEISDEALETMEGEALLRYVYEELGRKIVAAEEKMIIDAILAAPQTATATAPAVGELQVTAAGGADFINARALLTAEASDRVAIMTPALRAQYRALVLGGGFAYDVFDGMEVIENDYATSPIVGDLKGILCNYPNGDEIQFKFDDTTLMTSDLVRVLGRKPVAAGVVGNNYFAKITIG